ncbi:ORF6N domain-containing protein [Pedobacter changchengzhani]|uniref:ORF6N domain-containing protein n=1 Tax=Pedobacter changchengzhani TaxID=2529274 RepID=A0A4R5MIU3_9SPHI|nr:ORF6N domain-containing protein [Pedobacter changchengzhani]TDG35470.1 ORF6N domain-containing protein [Pedobacter changchengzhani]
MQIIQSVESKIYTIRGERVMLDFDLAQLYEVETKVLNQAVKRNIKRFPDDFMFRLSLAEWESMRSQIVTAYEEIGSSSQIVMISQSKRNTLITPFAFTEQGVAMLSGILKSDKAVNMNIAIMRAFVAVRRIFLQPHDDNERLKEIKERIEEHDIQLNQLYDAMDNLLDEKIAQKKWETREKIGFKIGKK